MYLKTLTARGFKSFADRIVLEFEPGISVIVGPNGSGKSNIADAVLWVLGEQSPRNLRGSRMEDVIFAGSATRQAMNMAEVSLSLDNTDRRLAVDFPEVVITRRLFRTGESEYLMNNVPCRLVDIQELLSDLGVGRELTAVIGQNRLDAIIRSGPEERRAFIEEAAGLRKHRRRKEKALRKLEGMERNLVRVKDIVSEVNKQLRPLERQARLAGEYQALTSEIRDLSIRILVAELEELKEQWDNRRREEERLLSDLGSIEERLEEGRERRLALENLLRHLREELERCRRREMRLLALGERLNSCRQLGRERLKLFAALLGEASLHEEWVSRREERLGRMAAMREERAEAEETARRAEEEEATLREEEEELSRQRDARRDQLDRLRRALQEGRERLRSLASEMARKRERLSALGGELEELQKRRRILREERENLEERAGNLEEELGKLRTRRKEVEERIGALRNDLARFEEELESVGRKQRRSFQEEALVVARLRALQEVFNSRIDYAAAAARVLEANAGSPGVLGILLHYLKVPQEWERALESYLGPWLFCVLTRGLDDALEAVRLLKEGEDGFGLFLPLSELDISNMEEAAELAKRCGGAAALSVVEYPQEIGPAVTYLLGDVVFCSDLEEAEAKAEMYPKLTFVTAEGDVVAPRRMVKGGARPRSPFHLIARRREIEELQEMLDLCDEESVTLEVRRKSVLATISSLRRELDACAGEKKALDDAVRESELALRSMLGEIDERVAEAQALEENVRRLEEERGRLLSGIREGEEEEARRKKALREMETPLREAESGWEDIKRREAGLREKRLDLRARRASLEERLFHLRKRIEELESEEARSAPVTPGDLSDRSRGQEELLELVERLLENHRRLTALAEERGEGLRRQVEEKEEELEGLRQELEELEARRAELQEAAHNRDLATAQLKLRVDLLVQRLLEEHKVPLETALTDYRPQEPLADMKARLEGLERRREMMGQVNLRAVEEYQALKERHDFLLAQVEDLRESKASLLKVVRAIDREIINIFRQTFEEVNGHFQEFFEKLFPQGRAELVLSDPTDLLNTGVEIEAQPKGKRLKKLTLLSGGETALISLAFLFAIFKTRPSPFYFLDEVEAALDDVNLHRFLNLLKELRKDSQLVVITHQKRTMEIAEVIYGVSMQASGISRVVSQKLEEAERLARTGTA